MRQHAGALRRRASLVRFAIVGLINTMLVYAAFSLLMRHHVHYVLACCCSSLVGLASSYLLNRSYTFRAGRPVALREVATFVLGYLLQLLLSIAVYGLLIDHLGLRYQLAFPIALVPVAAFSYTFMDRIVFRMTSVQALSMTRDRKMRLDCELGQIVIDVPAKLLAPVARTRCDIVKPR